MEAAADQPPGSQGPRKDLPRERGETFSSHGNTHLGSVPNFIKVVKLQKF